MGTTLGLDLGTNSIGWALVDDTKNRILGIGSRIFPEGVVRDKGKEKMSKNASRSIDRQIRRQFYRKRLRKIKLLETLIDLKMCPLEIKDLKLWQYYDKSKRKAGRKFPATDKFNQWLKLNPYELRAHALEKDLSKEEFGRILYHLIQRRGFLSNRKSKEEGKIFSGKDGVSGIKDTKAVLESKNITLGTYLHSIIPKENIPYKNIVDENGKEIRARSRYTLREMYKEEFDEIWGKQAKQLGIKDKTQTINKIRIVGNPYFEREKEQGLKKKIQHKLDYLKSKGIKAELIIDEKNLCDTRLISSIEVPLKEFFGGGEQLKQEYSVLFFQRSLRSQKGLLNECTFEQTVRDNSGKVIYSGKKPCPSSHPLFELKRAYEFINNIEYGNKEHLTNEQNEIVINLINSKETFDFAEIPKKLNLTHEKFNYDDKHKVSGNYTIKHLKPLFSDEEWNKEYKIVIYGEEHVEYGYERIWHCFYFYDNNKKLLDKLIKDFGFDKKNEEKIIGKEQTDGSRKGGITLKEGYGNLSLKAINNILPYLDKTDKKGNYYKQNEAVLLAGVKNTFGKRWDNFKQFHQELEDKVIAINRDKINKEGDAIQKIKDYLAAPENHFGFEKNDNAFFGLYHHSQSTKEKQEIKEELGDVPNLRNPIVQTALYELKSLLKAIKKDYLQNGETFSQINVELARDLKQSKEKRLNQVFVNAEREKENALAKEVLDEFGLAHSRRNIHKYLLWNELQVNGGSAICPYTGLTISLTDLFGKDNRFQIEHIVPYSKSLDDSLGNKTLCESKENAKKGEKTPYEFYKDEKKWEKISNRAFSILPYSKAKKFTSKTTHETDFKSQKLNDTRYISREAKNYLTQICDNVKVFPGQLTADLRHKWGLNNILTPIIHVEDDNLYGPHWAVENETKKSVTFFPVFNKRPRNEKGEFNIRGQVQGKEFSSKYLNIKVKLPGLENEKKWEEGNYWLTLKVNTKLNKAVQILKSKPHVKNNQVLLFGKVEKINLVPST